MDTNTLLFNEKFCLHRSTSFLPVEGKTLSVCLHFPGPIIMVSYTTTACNLTINLFGVFDSRIVD